MASKKTYETAILFTGDSRGAQKATRLTRKELEQLNQTQKRGVGVAASYSKGLGNVASQLSLVKRVATGAIAAFIFKKGIDQSRQFEKGLIGVSKTTGIVGADLDSLARDIDGLSRRIPVATDELLSLAQSAGQLGVEGKDNILIFTEVIAKLGRASDLAGEEGASSLARILNVMNEEASTVGTLASVIVSLGNNVAATESEIARITTEVARSTAIFDLGSANAAALGAAMASLGIRAELGGSSVGRTMQAINLAVQAGGKDLDDFASSVNLSGEELAKAFEEDKVAAFFMFLEGVASLGLDAGAALDELGLGGQEIAKTILPLAKNIDVYRKTQALANEEVKNATALDKEFEATLHSLDSQWITFTQNLSSVARQIGDNFLPSFTSLFKSINEFGADGGVETIVSGLKDLAALVAIGGTLYLGFVALPPIITAVSVSLWSLFLTAIKGQSVLGTIGLLAHTAAGGFMSLGAAATFASSRIPVIGTALAAVAFGTYISRIEGVKIVTASVTGSLVKSWLYAKNKISTAIAFISLRGKERDDVIAKLDRDLLASAKEVDQITANMRFYAAGLDQVTVAIDKNAKASDKASDESKKQVVVIAALSKEQQKLIDRMFPLAAAQEQHYQDTLALVEIYDTGKIGVEEYAKGILALSEIYEKTAATLLEKVNPAQAQLLDKLYPLKAAAREYAKELTIINALYTEGTSVQIDALTRLQLQYAQLFPEVARQQELAKAFEVSWTRSIERIDDAFFDFFRSGLDGFEEFKDGAVDIVKDLIAQILLNFAKVQLLNIGVNVGAAGLATSVATSAVTGGAGAASAGALGGLAAGGFGGLSSKVASVLPTSLGGTFGAGPNIMRLGGPDGLTVDLGGAQPGINFKQLGIGIIQGIAGSYVGTKLGEGLTGKTANSSIGATVGSIAGSFLGPLGTLFGSLLGGFFDGIFGSKKKDPRFYIKPSNAAPEERFKREDIRKITQSEFGGVHFNSDKDLFAKFNQQQANELFAFFDQIASLEDAIASQLGDSQIGDVQRLLADQEKLYKKNSGDFTPFFVERFELIFDAIGGAANEAFDKLTAGLSNEEFIGNLDVLADAALIVGQAEGDLRVFFDSLSDLSVELVQSGLVLDSTNQLLKAIGTSLLPLTAEGAAAAVSLVELSGGLSNFAQLTAQLGGFLLDETQQMDLLESSLADVFDTLNFELPRTKEGFEDILNSLDLSVESQRASYIALLTLVPQLETFFGQLEQQASEAAAAIIEVSQSVATLETRIQALAGQLFGSIEGNLLAAIDLERARIAELNEAERSLHAAAVQRYNDAISAEQSLSDAINNNIFGDNSTLNPIDKIAAADERFNELFQAAKSGDAQSAQELAQFASVYLQIARDTFASGDQFTQIFTDVNNMLGQIGGIFGNVASPGVGNLTEVTPLLQSLLNQQAALIAEIQAIEEQDLALELVEALKELSLATDQTLQDLATQFSIDLVALGNKLGVDLNQIDHTVESSIGDLSQNVSDGNQSIADAIALDDGSTVTNNITVQSSVTVESAPTFDTDEFTQDIIDEVLASIANLYSSGQTYTFTAYGGGGIADRASIFGEAGLEAAVPIPNGFIPARILNPPEPVDVSAVVSELEKVNKRLDALMSENKELRTSNQRIADEAAAQRDSTQTVIQDGNDELAEELRGQLATGGVL